MEKIENFSARFRRAVENDLAMPEALAVTWEVAKSNIPAPDKRDLIADFDQVLGLDLLKGQSLRPQGLSLTDKDLPVEIRGLAAEREAARKDRDWKTADELRKKIESLGWMIEDSPTGPKFKPDR